MYQLAKSTHYLHRTAAPKWLRLVLSGVARLNYNRSKNGTVSLEIPDITSSSFKKPEE